MTTLFFHSRYIHVAIYPHYQCKNLQWFITKTLILPAVGRTAIVSCQGGQQAKLNVRRMKCRKSGYMSVVISGRFTNAIIIFVFICTYWQENSTTIKVSLRPCPFDWTRNSIYEGYQAKLSFLFKLVSPTPTGYLKLIRP